jgi:hypothetical protein
MSVERARRKHTGTQHHHAGVLPRTGLAIVVGLIVLVGIIVLPAFASESTDDPGGAAAPTTTTSTTVAAEAVEATLVSLTDEERLAMATYLMTDEEKAAFGAFLSPPPPPPEPAPAPVEVAPTPAPAPTVQAAPAGSVWDDLAYCEAGGNWAHAPVGSYGYSGGLMFLPSTWRNYGGGEFASQAYQAGRDAQIIVAERILASHGGSYKAWPGCRSKLGLP